MQKLKHLAEFRRFLAAEALSVWIITLALALNVLAWVVPHGSYTNPTRDPLGLASALSRAVSDSMTLYYFWHAVIVFTFGLIAYSAYKICSLGLVQIQDRCDL
ncbi:MAG: hypothetical protein EOP07_11050 [Proteobacteria bacterium]|nr:MAG: hypothetical protein EOP07_11050 [Pseudomonadota bacterium]